MFIPKKYNLETPFAHVIKGDPDFTIFDDASLEAGGVFSVNLFWWHGEWPDIIKALPLKISNLQENIFYQQRTTNKQTLSRHDIYIYILIWTV